jgi:zinc protease
MLTSVFLIEVKPTEGHELEEMESAIAEEIARLAAEGPAPEEMERVKNQLEMEFLESVESLQDRASALNRYRYLVGDPGYLERDLQRYRDVTPEAVAQAAAALVPERRLVIRVRPAGADPK